MLKRARISLLLLITLTATVMFAGRASGAPRGQNIATIRIGLLFTPGSQADLGARLAVDELNNSGVRDYLNRPYQFEIIYPSTFPTSADMVPRSLQNLTSQDARAIFGPVSSDLALPNLEPLARVGVPVFTLATSDPLTDFDVTNNIMRMRAPESLYSFAAADYMLNDLGLVNIVLIQTDVESTEALVAYEIELLENGRVPLTKIQLMDNTELAENVATIPGTGADGVAMWGPAADAAAAFQQLRAAGWRGTFFYRHAQEAILSGEMRVSFPEGLIGANGWTYSTPTRLSRQFLGNFVSAYGRIPADEAAAAYDAVYVLSGQIGVVGAGMPELYESLLQMPTVFAVQGRLSPQEYGNGDFSRSVTVYEITEFGGTELLARYQNRVRLPDDDLITDNTVAAASVGTPTFTPTPSPPPTETPVPSATPSQVQLTVIADEVSVWDGPGTFFTEIGSLQRNSSVTVVGGDANLIWLVVQYRGGIGWVHNEPTTVRLFDPGGLVNQLPIIEAQPTPLGGVTATPAFETPDIVIEAVTLAPAQPQPGEIFVANVVLRNIGTAPTGAFTVSATFQPGSVFSSNVVTNIEPGASVTVALSASVVGGGDFAADVVADPLNEVDEGVAGEANNFFRLSYRVDFTEIGNFSNFQIQAGSPFDLAGGTPDLTWSGTSLDTVNGSRVGIVTGITYDAVNYDILTPEVINNGIGLTDSQIFPGVLIGVLTAEGYRAIIRVEGRSGTTLTISYRVYGN